MVFEGHPSWRSIITFYVKGLALTVVACAVAALITKIGGDVDAGIVSLVATVGVALTVLAGFILRVTTSYTITNRRLHIRRGVVSRTIQETRLDRVQNVNYRQGFLQRILQVGDVDFDTAGSGDDYDFTFRGVAQPEDVVHRVDAAQQAAHSQGQAEPRPGAV
jgi:uncharacterized membrane protein YdbT with pleckstrin-like domain